MALLPACQTASRNVGQMDGTSPAEMKMEQAAPSTSKKKNSPVVEKASSSIPKTKPYPLDWCLVTDDGLDDWDEQTATVYKGQEFKFCCKTCLSKFEKDPNKYVAKLRAIDG